MFTGLNYDDSRFTCLQQIIIFYQTVSKWRSFEILDAEYLETVGFTKKRKKKQIFFNCKHDSNYDCIVTELSLKIYF